MRWFDTLYFVVMFSVVSYSIGAFTTKQKSESHDEIIKHGCGFYFEPTGDFLWKK